MKLPSFINICGVDYTITYCDKPSDVDIAQRDSLWGQIDYWTRTIRIYKNSRPEEDVIHTILHEVWHAINEELHFDLDNKENHNKSDTCLKLLTDVLYRNKWIEKG